MRQVYKITHSDGDVIQFVYIHDYDIATIKRVLEPKGLYINLVDVDDTLVEWLAEILEKELY